MIDNLCEEDVIFAREPWSGVAESMIATLDDGVSVPANVKDAGFAYFLEIPLAREVLEVFEGQPPSLDEKIQLLLHYAANDAYPDWVYDRAPS